MTKGFVRVAYAKSIVVVETGQLTEIQLDLVKQLLGERFGDQMVEQVANGNLEVSSLTPTSYIPARLFKRGNPNISPERLSEIVGETLGRYAYVVGYDFKNQQA